MAPAALGSKAQRYGRNPVSADAGTSVRARDDFDYRPLHGAAEGNATDAIQALLSAEASIKAKDNEDVIPLHFAVRSCAAEVTSMFIDAGSDIRAKNNRGKTPFLFQAD